MQMTAAVVVMRIARGCRGPHVVMMFGCARVEVQDCTFTRIRQYGRACHRDGRVRLNRKAQYQQHDDEDSAAI